MIKSNKYLANLSSFGFKTIGDAAYGQLSGYPVRIIASPNGGRFFIAEITLQLKQEKESAIKIKKLLRQDGFKVKVAGRVVSINLKLKKNMTAKESLQLVKDIVTALIKIGIKPPCSCGVCGQGGTDTYIMQSAGGQQLYDTVHNACIQRIQFNLQNKAEENPGNYFTGIIGALIGAIIGTIPAILVLILLNTVSGWLFMLLPVGAYYGYKLLHGKMNVAAPVLSCLMSFVGLVFLLLVYDVTINYNYYDCTIIDAVSATLHYTFVEFSTDYWEWITADITTIGISYGLGLAFSIALICRTNKVELKDMTALRDTALPINHTDYEVASFNNEN